MAHENWYVLWRGTRTLVGGAALGLTVGFGGCVAGDPTPEAQFESISQEASECVCVPRGCPIADDGCSRVPARLECALLDCERIIIPTYACVIEHYVSVKERTACDGGYCVTGQCCTGCIDNVAGKGEDPVWKCLAPADQDVKSCGLKGAECKACTAGACQNPVCDDGVCRTTPKTDGTACSGAGVCENAACAGGECKITPKTDGTACTTGNLDGTCQDGKCCTGCVGPNGECLVGNEMGACGQDGKACESCDFCAGQACNAGECVDGPAPCQEATQCTHQVCDADNLDCREEPFREGGACTDLNPCTVEDACHNGQCVSGLDYVCPDADGNPCTREICNVLDATSRECVSEPVPNSDNQPCQLGCITDGRCVDSQCEGEGLQCEPRPCHQVGCDLTDPNNPQCDYVPDVGAECASPAPCITFATCDAAGDCIPSNLPEHAKSCAGDPDDPNSQCRQGECNPDNGQCEFTNVAGECADGNLCTTGDHCSEGVCSGSDIQCQPSNNCRENAECNPLNGACSEVARPDEATCSTDDGEDGTCTGGFCIPLPPVAGGAGGQGGIGAAGASTAGAAEGPGGAGEAGAISVGVSGAGTPGAAGSPGMAGTPTSTAGTTSTGGTTASAGRTSSAGSPNATGGTAGTTSAGGPSHRSGGTAGSANSAAGRSTGDIDPSLRYTRDPGGCACRSASGPDRSPPTAWLAALAMIGIGVWRRRVGRSRLLG